MKTTLTVLTFFLIFTQPDFAQNSGRDFWTQTNVVQDNSGKTRPWYPVRYSTFSLDLHDLKNFLAQAPEEANVKVNSSPYQILLPMPDGSFNTYRFADSPVMEKPLAEQFPDIKTYSGQGIEDPTATIRFDVTPFGFHGYVLSVHGTVYIDPLVFGQTDNYIVYYKSDIPFGVSSWSCELDREEENSILNRNVQHRYANPNSISVSGTELRTYRAAIACTGEYAAVFGGTVSGALAAITTTMNRVNGIYEKEVDIHMNLVGNEAAIIFTNASSDGYNQSSSSSMLTTNQSTIDANIGSGSYDIGHVFSTGSGGLSDLGCVCDGGNKAKSVTGSPSPSGDAYDVDYVAHEMGHQFGGDHTFNATTGSCGGGNRSASHAYEPGSSSTMMGYAGICSGNDLQQHSDAYFHTISFDQIIQFSQLDNGSTCPVVTATGNNVPVITVPATTYQVPYKTPFMLTASATDADNNSLTFCWEQFDLGPSGNVSSPSGDAPIFRSFTPVVSETRLFPKLSDILGSITTIGEMMPAYARTMHFRCTARDNRSGGAGVIHNNSLVAVSAVNTGTGFSVTSQNTTGITWLAGTPVTVTWIVAQTTAPPINTPYVNFILSRNNGQTFTDTVLTHIPNTGSYTFGAPAIATTNARIMVIGEGNIFFDINHQKFTITSHVGIAENILDERINVVPNPAQNEVHFLANNEGQGKCLIVVYDISGRKIRELIAEKNQGILDAPIDVSDLSPGMYIAQFLLPEGTAEKKFIKE